MGDVIVSDAVITALILEGKAIAESDARKLLHGNASFHVLGAAGNTFELRSRINSQNADDFCLMVCWKRSNGIFKLRRYNGKHAHGNRLERQVFFDFHIHQATERYQTISRREETYAEATSRYNDVRGAWSCLIEDCAVTLVPPADQSQLRLL